MKVSVVATTTKQRAHDPFEVALPLQGELSEQAWNLARPMFDWAVGFDELRRVYRAAKSEATLEGFLARALLELGVEWSANDLDLARIPKKGPCVVVANHPFGAIEGIVLASMLRACRKDVKLVANQLLWRLEAMREVLLPVDAFGGSVATQSNLPQLRAALRHLKSDGMLAVFPSGEVAHYRPQNGGVSEAEWSPSVAWLSRMAGAPVLPVHFAGQASVLVHALGLLHPRLRTALLPRELLRQRGQCLNVRVGAPISQSKLAALSDDQERAGYLRRRTLVLGAASPKPQRAVLAALTSVRSGAQEPLAPPLDSSLIAREIATLPAANCLLSDNERSVYYARAGQIPWTLRELGRLREQTFRAAREGTGKSCDLDEFDKTYLHLFSFDHRDQQIVGAYRLGLSDQVPLPSGLYTSTLFHLDAELFRRTGPAIEMGRSFVTARYQKSPSGLFLLWRGIGRFLALHPQYRVLFGPVSISADYSTASRELMVDFVTAADRVHPLTRYVRPKVPFGRRRTTFAGLGSGFRQLLDIEEVSQMVADVEPDQKGVPILFRQYLRLGGKMLGFNVDARFSGVLDGLVLVDLVETDPKILSRYLGAEAAAQFRARHAATG